MAKGGKGAGKRNPKARRLRTRGAGSGEMLAVASMGVAAGESWRVIGVIA